MELPALSNRGQGYRSARTHPGSNLACFLSPSYTQAHTHTPAEVAIFATPLYLEPFDPSRLDKEPIYSNDSLSCPLWAHSTVGRDWILYI